MGTAAAPLSQGYGPVPPPCYDDKALLGLPPFAFSQGTGLSSLVISQEVALSRNASIIDAAHRARVTPRDRRRTAAAQHFVLKENQRAGCSRSRLRLRFQRVLDLQEKTQRAGCSRSRLRLRSQRVLDTAPATGLTWTLGCEDTFPAWCPVRGHPAWGPVPQHARLGFGVKGVGRRA